MLHKIAIMTNGTTHDAGPTLQDINQLDWIGLHDLLKKQKRGLSLSQTKHPEYQ